MGGSNLWRYSWTIFWKVVLGGVVIALVGGWVLGFFLRTLLLGFGASLETTDLATVVFTTAMSLGAYFVMLKIALEASIGKSIAGIRLDYADQKEIQEARLAD